MPLPTEEEARYDTDSWKVVESFFEENEEFCFECKYSYPIIGNGRGCNVIDGLHYSDCPGVF